ncbi:ABC transporter permease [Virgibacillus sp. NKC19-3]|uniref:ABC transporter permease n=1 Tax=Virgibacillus saliphilus TaxID=2831674 RepID=UPI001C9B5E24|nr:ABC transporter permease [Virgibacillus sp. NKC19-3]MBY7141930.1 ABC transporter permease [Virgibacillus sp. NKC19-3]
MLKDLLLVELMKTRRSKLWLLVLIGPVLGVIFALGNFYFNYDVFMDEGGNGWLEAWTQVQIFYSPLIFPILTGVYAALVCRTEHVGNGWKQLLSFPIKRSHIYISKLIIVCLLLALTQVLLFLFFVAAGMITDISNDIPWMALLGFITKGWLASLPLAAIQILASIYWSSFGAPLALNIGLSLPALLIANSSFGQFYPWAQPMLAMSPADESPIPSYMVFYMLVLGLFLVITLIGIATFKKRDFA